MKIRSSLLVVLGVLLAGRAGAHEYWIEPSTFAPKVGETVGVQLRVGDGFPGEARARDPRRLVRLFMVSASGEHEIAGIDGQDPAGSIRVLQPGPLVVAYRSNFSPLTLDAKKFESYLMEEGLDHIVQERARLGESEKEGTERFSRAAKSLLRVQGADPATPKDAVATGESVIQKPVGMPAEITPVACDPTAATVGSPLAFSVVHNGAPAADRLVIAFFRDDPKHTIRLRTDAAGIVRFTPDRAGMWMLGNIWMKRADANTGANWESVWASLTFSIAPKADAGKGQPAPPAPAAMRTK